MYPKIVRVVYPVQYASRPEVEAAEDGVADAPDRVTVGMLGTFVELRDVLLIDGVPREVAAIQTDMSPVPGAAPVPGGGVETDVHVTLRHCATDRAFAKQLMPG